MFDVLTRPLGVLALAVALIGGAVAAAEVHPPVVPGFERFHNGNDPASAANPVEGGLILLGELGCTSCHAPDKAVTRLVLPKQAPILDQVGSRVRPGYLRAFLNDPQAVKPGTTMPHLLAALPAEERSATVEALVHFLTTTGTVSEAKADLEPKAIAGGKKLYHEIGCVACHGRRDRPAPFLAASMPLGELGRKYTHASLAAFLQDPLRVRPSGRMPRSTSSRTRRPSWPATCSTPPWTTPAHPRTTVVSRPIAPSPRKDAPSSRGWVVPRATSSVPAAPIASSLAAPPMSALPAGPGGSVALLHTSSGLTYHLDDRHRAALIAALTAVAGGKLPAPTPRDVVVRTMTAFNCYACHRRDGRGASRRRARSSSRRPSTRWATRGGSPRASTASAPSCRPSTCDDTSTWASRTVLTCSPGCPASARRTWPR